MPEPYFKSDGASKACACGCGETVGLERQFVSGHNLRLIPRTEEYRRRIGEGQKRAWDTKRQRMPLGSTRKDDHGYVLVKTTVGNARWEKEHAIVMERHIKRALWPEEQVHHINGIKDDNRIENLLLCADNSDHMRVEASFRWLLPELMAAGLVIFDHKERRYRLA